ncbi:uncharacterized protein [Haliotis cracherodii]|uniref:uncharacterized protein n=1 Tax=Haliotis cracherodii TaxID=6455 RepID=UPI0039EC83A8
MFGREPRLPVDLAFGIETNKNHQSLTAYAKSLKKKLQEAYGMASKASKTAQVKQKASYDLKTRGASVQIGDRVLVKALAFDGKHKLAGRWEEDPYVILLQPNQDIPVFVVQRESGEGRKRTLHRNHLLPIGSVPAIMDNNRVPAAKKPTPRPRKTVKKTIEEDIQENKESDYDAPFYFPAVTEDATIISEDTVEESAATSETTGDDLQSLGVAGDASGGDDHIPEEDSSTEADPEAVQPPEYTEEEPEDSVREELPPPVPPDANPQPIPAPRRTGRLTRKPAWQTSGGYVMCQTSDPGWQQRSRRLEQLAATGILGHISTSISKALLSLVDEEPE